MSTSLDSQLELLFAATDSSATPIRLEWHVLSRHGNPLLLLPTQGADPAAALQLYAAQRLAARLVRRAFPYLLRTPLRAFVPRAQIATTVAAPLIRFLASQTRAGERPSPPAILLGNQPVSRRRFILLGFDDSQRPIVVIKAGATAAAREAIEREAEILGALPRDLKAGLSLRGRLSTEVLTALAIDYCPGGNPRSEDQIESILTAWLRPEPRQPLAAFSNWNQLASQCAADPFFRALHQALAGQQFRTAIQHGDFAPWNIRVSPAGEWTAVDWERAELKGIPGWDWFHFAVQTAILRDRQAAPDIALRVEALLVGEGFRRYAAAAGIGPHAKLLFLSYLLFHNRVICPGEGLATGESLLQLLSKRWGSDLPNAT